MPDRQLESQHSATGRGAVIGIDEAGRGPWAGPVTAAACWLNPAMFDNLPDGLDDSKKLSARKRAEIFDALQKGQPDQPDQPDRHECAVIKVSVGIIDEIGILQATFRAMRLVAAQLQEKLRVRGYENVGLGLVDGNLTPDLGMPAKAIIKGDTLSLSIAAASIIAKQTRDALMCDLALQHSEYGWQKNMGYGTRDHAAALEAHGVTPHHRRSFAPIRRLLGL